MLFNFAGLEDTALRQVALVWLSNFWYCELARTYIENSISNNSTRQEYNALDGSPRVEFARSLTATSI